MTTQDHPGSDQFALENASKALFEIAEGDLRDQKPSASVSASTISDAVRAVTRLKDKGILLEIPQELAKGIASGELKRTGAAVRDGAGAIRGFLKDPSKSAKILSKSLTLAMVVVDIAQTVLLNEKLAQIQEQLGRIEDQLKALMASKLQSAFVEASRIGLYTSPVERKQRIHSALTHITEALPALRSSTNSKIKALAAKAKEATPNSISFFQSKLRAREQCQQQTKEIQSEIHLFASLLALRARLEDELGQHLAAAQSRNEMATYVLASCENISEIFQLGNGINTWSDDANFLNAMGNLLSFEGDDYFKTSRTIFNGIFKESQLMAAQTVRDHAFAQAIAPQAKPTYLD